MDENNEKEKKTKKQPEKEQEKKEMDKKENKKVEKKKTMLPIIIGSVLVIFLLVFSVIFSLISINNENILDNVSIMGIDVSNMSKEKAKEAVTEVITSKMQEELTLKKDDYETSLNANQINAQFDIDSAINEDRKSVV